MTNSIHGLNSGLLLNEAGFVALALKVKTSNGQTSLFYIQGEALRDLMMVLQNRLLFVQNNVANGHQEVAEHIEAANHELIKNLPALELKDVEQPDAGFLVNSLAVSFAEDGFKLAIFLKNESLLHIKVSDAQLQFIMVAIARALDNVKNVDLINIFTSGINYAPVYDALFKQDGSIDYSLIEAEQWKLDLFNEYVLIVYGIENKEGFKLKFGAVVKCHKSVNEQEIDIIARNFASKSKKIMPYLNQLAEIKTRVMPFEKVGIPSVNEALQPLADFHKALCN